MSPREIQYNAERGGFDIDGQPALEISRDDAVTAPLEALHDVTIASLERALAEYEDQGGATVNYVFLSEVPLEAFDPDTSSRDIALDFIGERLSAITGHAVEEGKPELDVQSLVAPLLARHDAELAGEPFLDDQGGLLSKVATFRLRGSNRTIDELYAVAVAAQALIDAAVGTGQVTAASARDLIQSGLGQVLLGQPENLWIDAKSDPHDLSTDAGKWEFAKDVAAFANTGNDALIVYGFQTSKQHGADILDTQRAFELDRLDIAVAWAVLNERLTPTTPDLEMEAVELRGGYGYGWVFIPAQAPYVLPILVTGMLEGDQVKGTYVSAPFRAGEHTVHWDASTLHGLIQAGRVALSQAAAVPHRNPSTRSVQPDDPVEGGEGE